MMYREFLWQTPEAYCLANCWPRREGRFRLRPSADGKQWAAHNRMYGETQWHSVGQWDSVEAFLAHVEQCGNWEIYHEEVIQ